MHQHLLVFFAQPYGAQNTGYQQPRSYGGRQRQNRQQHHQQYQQQQQQQVEADWTNIIPTISDRRPSASYANSFTYTGNFVFYGLRPSTEYEVIIQSRNREGWSDPNDIYKFTTRTRGAKNHSLLRYLSSSRFQL